MELHTRLYFSDAYKQSFNLPALCNGIISEPFSVAWCWPHGLIVGMAHDAKFNRIEEEGEWNALDMRH